MEYNSDKSAYANIMHNVGKIVKARLKDSYKSEKISFFMELSRDYLKRMKKEDLGYQALDLNVSGITKLICIESNADIYETGVSSFYDVDLVSEPKLIASITDEQCIGYIKNNFLINKNNIFKSQDHKRYFLICYSLDAIMEHDLNRIILNPTKIVYALEIDADAVENQLVKYNWHKVIAQENDEEKEDMEYIPEEPESKNEEFEYDVNTAFKSLTHSLPKKTRYKATKIYQKAA